VISWCGYLSGAKCKEFAYSPADDAATPSSFVSLKLAMLYGTFPVPAYPGCHTKEAVKQESLSSELVHCRTFWWIYLQSALLIHAAIS